MAPPGEGAILDEELAKFPSLVAAVDQLKRSAARNGGMASQRLSYSVLSGCILAAAAEQATHDMLTKFIDLLFDMQRSAAFINFEVLEAFEAAMGAQALVRCLCNWPLIVKFACAANCMFGGARRNAIHACWPQCIFLCASFADAATASADVGRTAHLMEQVSRSYMLLSSGLIGSCILLQVRSTADGVRWTMPNGTASDATAVIPLPPPVPLARPGGPMPAPADVASDIDDDGDGAAELIQHPGPLRRTPSKLEDLPTCADGLAHRSMVAQGRIRKACKNLGNKVCRVQRYTLLSFSCRDCFLASDT
jgi:hypothetical protein